MRRSYQKHESRQEQDQVQDALEAYVREGARQMLAAVLEVTVGLGPVEVRVPRVAQVPQEVAPQGFHSQVVQRYQRASQTTQRLFANLYLEGLATGDFEPVFRELVGETTALSANAVVRLKDHWGQEYQDWRRRPLEEHRYAYIWADGVYLAAGTEKEKTALLCILGAREDGEKELLAMESGYRESTESWAEVLRDLRDRGLAPPLLAVGDGALGLWAAMETPAFRTFIEFRQRHREDMQGVFVQTVKLARALGLARLGTVALDGSKVEANTSKHKAMSYGRMLAEEKRLQGEIQRLLATAEATDQQEDQEYGPEDCGYQVGQELARREQRLKKIQEAGAALEEREGKEHPGDPMDPKQQISFADPEARCFAKPSDGTRYVYNAQVAVDMESQIIVANHIEDSVSDAHAAEPVLERMEREQGRAPEILVTDAGYGNQDTLASCRQRGVTPVCATGREGKEDRQLGKLDRLHYDGDQDRFVCRHGHVFQFAHQHPPSGTRTYNTAGPATCTCGHYETADGREVLRVDRSHLAKRELQRNMAEPGHRELYRRRKCTVEPPFGQIKAGMGFRRFLYRGKEKVGSEWNLVCAAFNVKKLAALLGTSRHPTNPEQATFFSLAGSLGA